VQYEKQPRIVPLMMRLFRQLFDTYITDSAHIVVVSRSTSTWIVMATHVCVAIRAFALRRLGDDTHFICKNDEWLYLSVKYGILRVNKCGDSHAPFVSAQH
jgi:hypothetical protein